MFRIDRKYVSVTAGVQISNRLPEEEFAVFGEAALPTGEQPASVAQLLEECTALKTEAEEVLARARKQADELIETAHRQAEGQMDEARQSRAQILEEAEVERKETIAKADLEGIEIRGQAWQEGFEAGKSEAVQQMRQQAEADQESLRSILEQIDSQRTRMLESFEEDVVRLSLSIAKKIINTAIKSDDNMYESMVKHALNQMKREGKLVLRVSEREYQRFFASGTATFVLADGEVTATVVEDPDLGEGGLVLESDLETLDAGTDTQLKSIALAFSGASQGAPAEEQAHVAQSSAPEALPALAAGQGIPGGANG